MPRTHHDDSDGLPESSMPEKLARDAFHLLLGILAGLMIAAISEDALLEEPDVAHYRAVRDFVRRSYVRAVDEEELLDSALHGMLSGLDRYSRYYDPQEREELDRETSGHYYGIGVVFRPPLQQAQVLFTLPNSPAAKAKIAIGDSILKVDGQEVAGIDAAGFRELMSQGPGGELDLLLRGIDGSQREVRVQAKDLVDPTVRHVRIADERAHIGYISILSFSKETAREFEEAFRYLLTNDMRGLVVDLRRNYGGTLSSAETIAGRFISEGVIVRTEGRGDPEVTRADPAQAHWAGFPLVLLVDGESASASEVLAGALQDHRCAVLVGAPTFGKGLVQVIRRFEEQGSVAKITSSYYYSPAGRNFDKSVDETRDWGILPDVEVELTSEEAGRIHRFLESYGPPPEALPVIEALEMASGQAWIDEAPPDRQLEAALELLRGRRPSATQVSKHG